MRQADHETGIPRRGAFARAVGIDNNDVQGRINFREPTGERHTGETRADDDPVGSDIAAQRRVRVEMRFAFRPAHLIVIKRY